MVEMGAKQSQNKGAAAAGNESTQASSGSLQGAAAAAVAAKTEMLTRLEDIQLTNSPSAWMADVEQDVNQLRQLLQAKLAQVPATAIKVSGPRDDHDVSHILWEKVKHKVGVDFEQPLTVSQWKTHIKEVNVEREFMPLDQCTDTEMQDKMLLVDKKIRDKNRYSDILAYKHSRVHLVPRASLETNNPLFDGYINANFVDGPLGIAGDRKIIACQGPLENTFPDLWRMVSQENVTLIVTTCNVYEAKRPKCHHFWPLEAEDSQNPQAQFHTEHWQAGMQSVGISVQLSGPTIRLTPNLYLRKFKLTDNDLGITDREIRQLHYTGWPDHGVPQDSSMLSFSQMFEIFTYMLLASDPSEKAIVHCSAGIGRTGTTISLAHLITSLWAQKNQGVVDPQLSVFSTVRRLREQRYHLVQMPGQYEFIHQFLNGYLNMSNF